MATRIPEIIFGQVFDRVLDTVAKPSVSVASGAERDVAKAVAQEVAPIIVNATNSEPWYQSRVILGGLVALGASVAGFFGIIIDEQSRLEIIQLVPTIATAAGALYALYGRIFGANKKPLGAK